MNKSSITDNNSHKHQRVSDQVNATSTKLKCNQFNRVTYALYPMEKLLSTAYNEIGDYAAQRARTQITIRKEFTKNLNIRKRVETNINWTVDSGKNCGHCTARLMPNAECKPWLWQTTYGDTATCNTWTRNPDSIPSDLCYANLANSIPQSCGFSSVTFPKKKNKQTKNKRTHTRTCNIHKNQPHRPEVPPRIRCLEGAHPSCTI